MDPQTIKPYIEAIQSVFSTMLHLQVKFGKAHVSEMLPRYDISGIIGMSGDVVGTVVLSLPAKSGELIVEKFAGAKISIDGPDFADAVGELVNMISGCAKSKFVGKTVSISCPSVIIGKGHKIACMSDTVCVCIPCMTDCGEFAVDISIKRESGAGSVQTSTTAALKKAG
jgi:chemotaxis protein CheX